MSRTLEALVILCIVAVNMSLGKDEKPAAENSEGPKTYRRLIPADVLRGKSCSQKIFLSIKFNVSGHLRPFHYTGNGKRPRSLLTS